MEQLRREEERRHAEREQVQTLYYYYIEMLLYANRRCGATEICGISHFAIKRPVIFHIIFMATSSPVFLIAL